jgi:hypothetical protein
MSLEDVQTFDGVTNADKRILLQLMGYDTDGVKVLKPDGTVYMDPYSGGEVLLDNMAVFPGSWIVIDYNEVSLNGYLAHHDED